MFFNSLGEDTHRLTPGSVFREFRATCDAGIKTRLAVYKVLCMLYYLTISLASLAT